MKNDKPKPGGRRYPWAKWFKKSQFTLVAGKDYDCRTHGMAQMLRNRASSQFGVSVSLSIRDDLTPNRIEVTVNGAKHAAHS